MPKAGPLLAIQTAIAVLYCAPMALAAIARLKHTGTLGEADGMEETA